MRACGPTAAEAAAAADRGRLLDATGRPDDAVRRTGRLGLGDDGRGLGRDTFGRGRGRGATTSGSGGFGLPRPGAGGLGRLRLGLVDDRLAAQLAAVRQSADAIGRRVVDARRVALHPDLELVGEVEHYLVLDAELPCELVDPDLLGGQSQIRPLLLIGLGGGPILRPFRGGSVQSRTETLDFGVRHGDAERPSERLALDRLVEARRRARTDPGSPTRLPPADAQTSVRSPGDPIELSRGGLAATPDAAALGLSAHSRSRSLTVPR